MTWEEQKRLAKMTVEDRLLELSSQLDGITDYSGCRVRLDGAFTVDELDMIIQATTGPRGHGIDNPDCAFNRPIYNISRCSCSCEADRLK